MKAETKNETNVKQAVLFFMVTNRIDFESYTHAPEESEYAEPEE